MRIIGLHHAQITIPKGAEEQARKFYLRILGLAEIEKPASLRGQASVVVARNNSCWGSYSLGRGFSA